MTTQQHNSTAHVAAAIGHLTAAGPALLDNGYLIVPIKPGEKRPAISNWQNARLTHADLPSYAECGAGVLCGQGDYPIAAIDIDVSHVGVLERLTAWCSQNLGMACERVGAAPRVLLVYRAAEAGWPKAQSLAFFDPLDPVKLNGKRNEQRVEVLGAGQQFVAYHDHPDTGKPYRWTDLFGGIAYAPAEHLPTITREQVNALLAEFERIVRDTAGVQIEAPGATLSAAEPGDALAALAPRMGLTIEQGREWLAKLPNCDAAYDDWVHVGMALHHEFEGSPEALQLWRQWGAQSAKDDPSQYVYKWQSFAKSGHRPITFASVVRKAKEHSGEAADDLALSDVFLSRELAAHLAGRFLFEHDGRGWLAWRDGVWQRCAAGEEVEEAKSLGPRMLQQALANSADTEKLKQAMKLANRAMSAGGITAALQLAKSDPRIAARPDQFDRRLEHLNAQNAIIDLRTGEALPHDPTAFMSRQCPVAYEVGAPCPRWLRFLEEISLHDADWIDYWQRLCGYLLSGHVREEVMVFMLGKGSNGKSVFANVLRRILGNYAVSVPSGFLTVTQRDGEGATPSLAALPGARVAFANEVEAGSRLSAQTVKVACSTEAIAARHLYGKVFSFVPTHKLLVRGNHKPIIVDNDEGIWRRIHLVPFDRHFREDEKDVSLEERLSDELPGILAWMVAGFRMYLERGLRPARRVAAASLQYRTESDLIGQWLADDAECGQAAQCIQQEAFRAYQHWCHAQGLRPITKKSFTQSLEERGMRTSQRGSGARERVYVGFRLTTGFGDPA